jgi:hypothetical protein
MLSNDEDLLRKCFAEHTGQRPDLKFGDIPWMSHYTWVCISAPRKLPLNPCFTRPNIRMVEKFGFGRVYVAGGKLQSQQLIVFPQNHLIDAGHVHSPTGGQVRIFVAP